VQGRHPLQTSDALGAAKVHLGAHAQGLIVYLNKIGGMSYGKIRDVFSTALNFPLSRSTGARAVLRAGRRAEPAYREIEQATRRSRKQHIDETGWRVGGVLWWLWVFVAMGSKVVLYRIRNSRGFDVLQEVLGAAWSGMLHRDGWAVYDRLGKAIHQLCLRHILTRCEEMLKRTTGAVAQYPLAVQAWIQSALKLRERWRAGEISEHGFRVARGRLMQQRDWLTIFCRKRRNKENEKLRKHLFKHWWALATFLWRPRMDATNWLGEQMIRPAVVNRKVWGGNRTPAGAHAQEVLMSVLQTLRFRKRDPIRFLTKLFQARPGRQPELLSWAA
jgi:transposase